MGNQACVNTSGRIKKIKLDRPFTLMVLINRFMIPAAIFGQSSNQERQPQQ